MTNAPSPYRNFIYKYILYKTIIIILVSLNIFIISNINHCTECNTVKYDIAVRITLKVQKNELQKLKVIFWTYHIVYSCIYIENVP